MVRHSLIQNMWLGLKVKPEFPPPNPSIFGILEMEFNDNIHLWIEKGRVDNFVLRLPKKWDLTTKGNRMSTCWTSAAFKCLCVSAKFACLCACLFAYFNYGI